MLTIQRLSLADAQELLAAAQAKSQEIGVPMDIAVVDESGHLVAFVRMDGAKQSSIDIAINKAWTAACAKRPTAFYNEIAVPGKPTFGIDKTNQGRFIIIPGGIPVEAAGVVVGAIGVSAGTAEQDTVVADAAVAAYYAAHRQ